MYREIEFRGQRIDNNEWIYGFYVKEPKGKHLIYWKPFDDASSNTYHFVKPESIGQWTGLDIEGKKVYENQKINKIDLSKRQLLTAQQALGYAVMRSNIKLLIISWCILWGILGMVFCFLWLWRYFA